MCMRLQVVWNRNPLLPQQWAAVAMVFGGLVTSSLAKHRTKPKLHAKTH
jgi:UDP-galactose transporter B1